MRIAMLTTGTRGDVQPFLLLARRLADKGHQVMLCAAPDLVLDETKDGVMLKPIGYAPTWSKEDQINWMTQGQLVKMSMEKGHSERRSKFYWAQSEDAYKVISEAGADLIIFKYAWITGYSIAENLDIPCMGVDFFPVTSTRDFPCFLVGHGEDRGRLRNALTWWVGEEVVGWWFARPLANRLRQLMGLKPFSHANPYKKWRKTGKVPVFYAYSPAVLPKASDWPDHIHVTGIWQQPIPEGWSPPEDLVAFLENGPPPVYIGFGSMVNDIGHTLALILESLALSGCRGVIFLGSIDDEIKKTLPRTVFCVQDVPHVWLFPRMAAVVHHGGAGTTMTGIASGVPSIITPGNIDQYSWGRIVQAHGIGLCPISFSAITSETLAQAIKTATENDAICHKAAEMGALMRMEDGIQETVRLIESYLDRE
jgi:UDP:flavonoid glycosyltransferase YjiC (YdhE family)